MTDQERLEAHLAFRKPIEEQLAIPTSALNQVLDMLETGNNAINTDCSAIMEGVLEVAKLIQPDWQTGDVPNPTGFDEILVIRIPKDNELHTYHAKYAAHGAPVWCNSFCNDDCFQLSTTGFYRIIKIQ